MNLINFVGERNPLHRDAASMGNAPNSASSAASTEPRVPEGDGASRLDPHAAQ